MNDKEFRKELKEQRTALILGGLCVAFVPIGWIIMLLVT